MTKRDFTSESTRKHMPTARPIVCSRCNNSGGTLVKVGDHYEHQNKVLCEALRRERISRRS